MRTVSNNGFDILIFELSRSGKGRGPQAGRFMTISCRPIEAGRRKTPSYMVVFSNEIAEMIKSQNIALNYVLRRDSYSGELALILGKIDGAPSARYETNNDKDKQRIVISNAELVKFLGKYYNQGNDFCIRIDLGENLSRNDDALLFKLGKIL